MANSASNKEDKLLSGAKISNSAVWSIAERVSTQGVTFVVTLIMARLLTPEDFGLIGMLTIFVELGATLCTSGLTHALIKENGGTPAQAGSVLLFNLISGSILYGIVWLCSPFIAEFYNIPELCRLSRMIAVVIPLRGLSTLATARLMSRMYFKLMGIASIAALTTSGLIGIAAAIYWKNVDAIVAFQVANALFTLLALSLASARAGKISFRSPAEILPLLRFGIHISGSAISDFIYTNSYLIAIGKLFPAADVGYFSKGRQIASVPPISIGMVVKKVAYPALCRYGDDKDMLVGTAMKIMRVAMYVVFPLMVTIALNAESIVLSLLGEKWIASSTMLSILCIGTLLIPMDSVNLTLLPAGGRPDLMLKVEICRKIVGLTALLCSLPFGIFGICWGYVIASLSGAALCMFVSKKEFGISLRSQTDSVLRIMLPAYVAAGLAYRFSLCFSNVWLMMLIGCIGSMLAYYSITRIFGYEQLKDIRIALKKFIKR